jgi:hypothetical protein
MNQFVKLVVFVFLSMINLGHGQTINFFRDTTVHVVKSGTLLKNAWAGGINSGVFAEMELNGDNLMDIVVYSSSSGRISPFINKGLFKQASYEYAPEYVSRFPNDLEGWIRTFDYDFDGDMDLFTYVNASIRIYRNDFNTSTGLNFSLAVPMLYTHYGTFPTNIYVSRVNIPSIIDVDNDGDMDVLAFSIGGGWIEYHRNFAMDSTGNPSNFIFYNVPQCWGYFSLKANYNAAALPPINSGCPLLPADPYQRIANPTNKELEKFIDPTLARHAGSVLLTFDMGGDGDKDVLNGDILSNNLLFVENCGTADSAWMCAQDSTYPVYDVPAIMNDVAAPYYMDVDNDNKKDLIISNFFESGEDYYNVSFYENTTDNNSNVFSYQTNRWLVNQMIEVGTGAHPAFFDVDNDGKKDMLIANDYVRNSTTTVGKISLYRNVSTSSNKEFQFVTDDFASLSTTGLIGLNLTFGDLDGDGDRDMLVGESGGGLVYYENTAPVGSLANFVFSVFNYQSINVGDNAAPQLIDVNRDGLLDLIIGERTGVVNYYQNTGTPTAPIFSLINANFGGIDVKKATSYAGFSAPVLFDNGQGYEMLVGSLSGYIYHYKNIDGNLSGSFILNDSMFQNIFEPGKSSVAIYDIDQDTKMDLIIGNQSGGLVLYTQNSTLSVNDAEVNNSYFNLFPNPASELLNLQLNAENNSGKNILSVYDVTGKKVFEKVLSSVSNVIDVSTLTKGFYLIQVNSNNRIYSNKFIKD